MAEGPDIADDAPPRSEQTPEERARELIGTVVADRYRIDEVVAMGGVGAVYRGEHVHMRKRLAIKLLHPETEGLPELVQRFERESIVGANATHPNVASATDFGKLPDGSYYLILEYIEGITVHDLLRKGRIPPKQAVEIARQIAQGLHAIHKLDIVHRDLKPRNVMVSEGPPLLVKLIDFGFAKVPLERFASSVREASALTSQGTVFGTVGYMAPETAFGMMSVTPKSDLYALGVILYEMLVGKHPYDAKEPKALYHAHQFNPPPSFAERAPDREVPEELEAITMRLLEKAPRDRYGSAREVIDALDAMAWDAPESRMPGSAKPASTKPASQKPASQKPVSEKPASAKPASARSAKPDAAKTPSTKPTPRRRSTDTDDDASPPPAHLSEPPRIPMKRSVLPWIVVLGLAGGAGAFFFVPGVRARVMAIVGKGEKSPATSKPTATEPPPPAPPPTASAPPSTSVSAAPPPTAAPSASVERPTQVDGRDAAGWRTVLRSAAITGDAGNGAKSVLALAQIDPEMFKQTDIVADTATVVVAAELGDRTLADQVWELLGSDRIGPAGPDVLYQIVTQRGGSRAAERAQGLLHSDDLKTRISPALAVAMALRETPCRDKPTLFERAANEGDQRSLMLLMSLRQPDCTSNGLGCCVPPDGTLDAAVRKLGERVRAPN
jgi:eukaryotic-like serine/threonine-protein kinase